MNKAVFAAMLTLIVASSAAAALSPQYEAWRNGPVQWIMTGTEKSAWKKVKSDEEATLFIDLFWARRDPTPGTAANEARDEREAREKQADDRFSEPRKRGSLTDRGRAWYVLGPPPNYTENSARIALGGSGPVATGMAASQSKSGASSGGTTGGDNSLDPAGGRQLGARDIWIWEHDAASAKFNLPRVEIIFITDPITRRTIRDLARRDFGAAEAAVLKKQIVTPDLKELPAWAAFGGLQPMTREVRFEAAPAKVVVPKPVEPEPAAAVPALPTTPATRGASRFTLVNDAYSIDAQTPADPFDSLRAAGSFKKEQELGWVAQYCSGTDQEISVPFILHITGTANGKKVDRATAPDELVPDRLKARPGCSMIRGALPLDDFLPGTYRLELMIDDPIDKTEYVLHRDFTVE